MDRIVYLVVTKPGGVDGLDASDKGGIIKSATLERPKAKIDGWSEIKPVIVDFEDHQKKALAKLNPLDKLVSVCDIRNGGDYQIPLIFKEKKNGLGSVSITNR